MAAAEEAERTASESGGENGPAPLLPAVPDIFGRGDAGASVTRCLVLGNGSPGAEGQCLGLVRALGLGGAFTLQRVSRPTGRHHEWLRWLPPEAHRSLDAAVHRAWAALRNVAAGALYRLPATGGSDSHGRNGNSGGGNDGRASVIEADPEEIAMDAIVSLASREGPLLVVASGRDTAPAAAAIKSLSHGAAFVVYDAAAIPIWETHCSLLPVLAILPPPLSPLQLPSTCFSSSLPTSVTQIQHPRMPAELFDAIVAPAHDFHAHSEAGQRERPPYLRRYLGSAVELPGPTVTIGALHAADASALRSAAAAWHGELADLPRPLIAVSVGGPTRNCWYGGQLAVHLCKALTRVLARSGGTARVSFSRRTPSHIKSVVQEQLGGHPNVYIWDGRGANPHFGHLAWADAFVVTGDSVSMLSEACTTGKPVYVVGRDLCRWKFAAFHRLLEERGATRPLTGDEPIEEYWSYPPLTDNANAAAKIRAMIAERNWSIAPRS
eukprot:SM000115S23895  [mRNA]  locus=s115:39925:44398:- [translate_table: standard]